MGIDHFNRMNFVSGVHLSFFVIANTKWRRLWKTLVDVERHMNLPEQFYNRCRIIVYLGALFFLTDWSVAWAVSTRMPNLANAPKPFSKYGYFFYNLLYCCASSVVVLFLVLAAITGSLFRALRKSIKSLFALKTSSTQQMNFELEKWKQHHALVAELAVRLDNCFGWVLLITIGHDFVTVITSSFQIVQTTYLSSFPVWRVYMTWFCSRLTQLTLIACTSNYLQYQGRKLNNVLWLQLRPSPHLRTLKLECSILSEVSRHCPRITAANFFDVNYSLFPSLVGTALTYCIILSQASSYGMLAGMAY